MSNPFPAGRYDIKYSSGLHTLTWWDVQCENTSRMGNSSILRPTRARTNIRVPKITYSLIPDESVVFA